jgi:hypothetical protein
VQGVSLPAKMGEQSPTGDHPSLSKFYKKTKKNKKRFSLQNKECTYPSKGTQAHLAFGCESVAQVK